MYPTKQFYLVPPQAGLRRTLRPQKLLVQTSNEGRSCTFRILFIKFNRL